jgi:hypothetical protein
VGEDTPSQGGMKPIVYLMPEGYGLWAISYGNTRAIEPVAYYEDWKVALERAVRHACREQAALLLVDPDGQPQLVDCADLYAIARRWEIQLDP